MSLAKKMIKVPYLLFLGSHHRFNEVEYEAGERETRVFKTARGEKFRIKVFLPPFKTMEKNEDKRRMNNAPKYLINVMKNDAE